MAHPAQLASIKEWHDRWKIGLPPKSATARSLFMSGQNLTVTEVAKKAGLSVTRASQIRAKLVKEGRLE